MLGSLFVLSWVGLLATLGLAWHACLLVASAALAICGINQWLLRRRAHLDPWRLGVRCLLAGCLGLLAAAALGFACLIAGMMGWCRDIDASTMILVGLTGALTCGVQSSALHMLPRAAPWLLLAAGTAVVMLGVAGTAATSGCLAAVATLAYLAAGSWSLAREGTAMLAAAEER